MEDSCAGTLTRVTQGSVTVRAPQPHDHRARRQALPGEAAMRRAPAHASRSCSRSPRPPPRRRSPSTRRPTPARASGDSRARSGARCLQAAGDRRGRHDHGAGGDVPAQSRPRRARRGGRSHDHRCGRTDHASRAGAHPRASVSPVQHNQFAGLTIAGGRESGDTGGNVGDRPRRRPRARPRPDHPRDRGPRRRHRHRWRRQPRSSGTA